MIFTMIDSVINYERTETNVQVYSSINNVQKRLSCHIKSQCELMKLCVLSNVLLLKAA